MRQNNIGISNNAIKSDNLQGYHAGADGEAYAFAGFDSNKLFTSDRTIALDSGFNRADGKPMKGYGLEIETGWGLGSNGYTARIILANIFSTAIFPIFPKALFKMQSDSTITGVECITQVMTKEFIRNNYKAFKTMYNDYFPMFAIRCDDGHCGMHVNLSVGLFGTTEKTREEAIRKLYYIVNKHYDLMLALTYRDARRTNWCGRMPHDVAKTMDVHAMSSSHHNCFNGSHYDAGRVELRFVGGQKNFACFRNTMESIFHLVDRVKTIGWSDCDDVVKIFEGCNSYVFDRLSTLCFDRGTISSADIEAIRGSVVAVRYL